MPRLSASAGSRGKLDSACHSLLLQQIFAQPSLITNREISFFSLTKHNTLQYQAAVIKKDRENHDEKSKKRKEYSQFARWYSTSIYHGIVYVLRSCVVNWCWLVTYWLTWLLVILTNDRMIFSLFSMLWLPATLNLGLNRMGWLDHHSINKIYIFINL